MHVEIVFAILAYYVAIVYGADQCPANLQRSSHLRQFGGKCYEFIFNHPGDWYHANSDCRKKGGILVDIIEPTEQSFIYNSMKVLGFAHDKGVWIGLTDESSEGNWRWASGRRLEYNHWARGQPGLFGSLEDCALMEFKDGGYWHDYPCHGILFNTQNHGWVCKYNLVQPTTAATVPVTTPLPVISTAKPFVASSRTPTPTPPTKSPTVPATQSTVMPFVASSSTPTPTPPTKSHTSAGFETRAPMTTLGFETRAPRTTAGFETRAPRTSTNTMPLVASTSTPTPTPPTKSTAGFETRAPMTTFHQ